MLNTKALFDAILTDAKRLPVRLDLDGGRLLGFAGADFPREAVDIARADGISRAVIDIRLARALKARVELNYDEVFGALDYTVWFENDGDSISPVISRVDALNIEFESANPVLSGILGDHENYYRPYETRINAENARFRSDTGRPTHVYFPYFNLKLDGGDGVFSAIGWGGTWEALFERVSGGARYIARGTNGLDAYLKPGERVRTPLMLILPYQGLTDDQAMNLWRRYYVNRVLPKQCGAPIKPMSTTCLACDTGLPNSDGSISERYFTWKPSLEKMLAEGVNIDVRWFDAGWYVDPNGDSVPENWWGTVGAWALDPVKWPGDSFRESADYARAHGMKTLIWFEPERVTHVDALVKNFGYNHNWALGDPNGDACGNDIGVPECLDWTRERILAALDKCGADMYREDNNFNARPCWAALDAKMGAHRAGITENKAVQAHYALWDRVIAFTKSRGGMAFIDSCASGGGRNDLESMKRAVPLLRSDADRTSTSLRLSMTTAFNRWIPYCGASCTEQTEQLAPDGSRDMYIFRASYLPALNLSAQWTRDANTDFALIRRGLSEWRAISALMLKDFHVLTPWRAQDDTAGFTAFAYSDPDTDETALFVFRMENCETRDITLPLFWLSAARQYALTDYDTSQTARLPAEAIAGFKVTLSEKRSAALYHIRRV